MKNKTKMAVKRAAIFQVCATPEPIYFCPNQLASRWRWHEESIRRALRQRRIESVIIGRRRLIPIAAVLKIEAEGRITRNA